MARTGVLLVMGLLPVRATGGELVRVHPSACFAPVRFELEYRRPWAELPIDEGRVAASTPVLGPVWVGASVQGLRAPTVDQTGLGLILRIGSVLRTEMFRRETRVSGLPPVRGYGAIVDLRLRSGAWDLGARTELEESGTPGRDLLLRREIWLSVVHDGGDLTLSRRTTAWSATAGWSAGVRLRAGGRVRAGLYWDGTGLQFTVEFGAGPLDYTASTAWSGPQTGAVGLRIAEAP